MNFNISEITFGIQTFSFTKTPLKISSAKGLPFCPDISVLTHWGQVTHICISKLHHHWLKQWLVTWSAPSHYLNQCWNIFNWTLRNKFRWNLNQNSYIFIQENAFENVVWEMAAIFSQPQYVNKCHHGSNMNVIYNMYITCKLCFNNFEIWIKIMNKLNWGSDPHH